MLIVISQGKAVSGQGGALWEVLPIYNQLFNHLKERQDKVLSDESIFTNYYTHAVNAAFVKMKQYYTLTDQTPFYRIAVALYPLCRIA